MHPLPQYGGTTFSENKRFSAEPWKSHLQPHVPHKRESSFVSLPLGDLFDEL